MTHELRRTDRRLDEESTAKLLNSGEYGILSTFGEDGYPYGTPVNYVYSSGKIYFHCAPDVGHKEENLAHCNKVCFTVVGETRIAAESFTEKYQSAVAFGTAKKLQGEADRRTALTLLIEKYAPEFPEKGAKYVDASWNKTDIYEIALEQVTGKINR